MAISNSLNNSSDSMTVTNTCSALTLQTSTAASYTSINAKTISMLGSDTDIGLTITPKGAGGLTLSTGNFSTTAGSITSATTITATNGDLTLTDGDEIIGNRDAGTTSPITYYKKSRSGAALTSGDLVGTIKFAGYDGTQYTDGARITSTSSGTIASTRVASDLKFYTHPDSAAADPTLRMTIASTGATTIASPDSGVGLTVSGGGVTCTSGAITATSGNVVITSGNLTLPTTSSTIGQITLNGDRWFHGYGDTTNNNLFIGREAGNFTLTTGSAIFNVGCGRKTLLSLTSGAGNVACGNAAGYSLTSGSSNVMQGAVAGFSLTQGSYNLACGDRTLYRLTTGNYNVVYGYDPAGSGYGAGYAYTSGESSNILFNSAGVTGESNKIRIGDQGTGNGQQNAAYIAGIYNTAVGATAGVVLSDSAHKLGGLAGAANTILVGGTKPSFTATPQCTDLTLTGILSLPTTSTTVGIIKINSVAWAHAYGTDNTFIGKSAGNLTLTTANSVSNTGIGYLSLAALVGTNAGEAAYNTAGGIASLTAVDAGSYNTAWGVQSGSTVTTGNYNSFFGYRAGYSSISSGVYNTMLGANTGDSYTASESSNILIGYGVTGTAAEDNTLRIGKGAGTNPGEISKVYIANAYSNYGTNNIFVGSNCGNLTFNTTNAIDNVGIGVDTLSYLVGTNANEGARNTAVGYQALLNLSAGSYNAGFGQKALNTLTTGTYNTACGYGAGSSSITTGAGNVFLGASAGASYTSSESYNIIIGYGITGTNAESHVLRIGDGTGTTNGQIDTAIICGITGKTSTSGAAVYVNSSNVLGTSTSNRDSKEEIADMGDDSSVIYSMRPRTFKFKNDVDPKPKQFGMIAEEVEEVFPDMVLYDTNGKPWNLAYQFLAPMLVNEIQKLKAKIDSLEARINTLEGK